MKSATLKWFFTIGFHAVLIGGCGEADTPSEGDTGEPSSDSFDAINDAGSLEVEGLSTPESALHDEAADIYLVSNINGSPSTADDNGFISSISPNGEMIALKWIDGASDDLVLNAPKGMGIFENTLYVADITAVRRFDRMTGDPLGDIEISEASFLNDIAVSGQGLVYVSDSRGGAIYEIEAAGDQCRDRRRSRL
jgi:hypothetical protein